MKRKKTRCDLTFAELYDLVERALNDLMGDDESHSSIEIASYCVKNHGSKILVQAGGAFVEKHQWRTKHLSQR